MDKYNIQTDETTHISGIQTGSGGGRSIELVSAKAEDVDSVGRFTVADDGENLSVPVLWMNTDICFGVGKINHGNGMCSEVLFDWLSYDSPISPSFPLLSWLGIDVTDDLQVFQNANSGMTFLVKDHADHPAFYMVISKRLKKFMQTVFDYIKWDDDYGFDVDLLSKIEVLTPVFDYEKTKALALRYFDVIGYPGGPDLFD